MNSDIITFGEIMLRLSPPNFKRFSQSNSFDVTYGGAEANVAVSLANFGFKVSFVTKIPQNDIGESCIQYLNKYNVKTKYVRRGGERLGIYFLEKGTTVRSSKVIYDRTNSSVSTVNIFEFDWDKIFQNARWFHWTGITPALSQNLADIILQAIKKAKEFGLMVSCDLNYRSKLWNYGKNPSEIMKNLMKYCDIVVGNEEDFDKVFGIIPSHVNISSGEISGQKYEPVSKVFFKRFPNVSYIAITLRGSISATHNIWTGILFDKFKMYEAPLYDLTYIVDRVGSGDAFNAGLIYGFFKKMDLQKILEFAVAASCLKHTIEGDFNLVSIDEVEKLINGNISGRIVR
ncbi:MAG: sugar kinase [Candidatus Lokiarchaeota archaeon]